MASSTSPLVTKTFTYTTDSSAGEIPATVHFAPASAASSAASRPVALIFHAGGFVCGSAAMVPAAEIAVLARLGFVVVTPEYRLAPQVSVYDGALADAKACLWWIQVKLAELLQSDGVAVDGARVVAMGHSAGGTLALHLGSARSVPRPVAAVADFYAAKLLGDEWAHTPLAPFAGMPVQDAAYTAKVYEGPVPFSSPPMFKEGKPDFSVPRNAWMIDTLRQGTNTKLVVKDGDYARVDPVQLFAKDSAPTIFVHGDKDVFVPLAVAQKAYDRLQSFGVRTVFVQAKDQAHVFDFQLKEEDALFQEYVMPALRFLARHAGLQV